MSPFFIKPIGLLVQRVLLVPLLLWGVRPALSQEVHLVVSSQAGDRLTAKPSIHFEKGGSTSDAVIEIHDDVRRRCTCDVVRVPRWKDRDGAYEQQ
jgi:hypothetical protein